MCDDSGYFFDADAFDESRLQIFLDAVNRGGQSGLCMINFQLLTVFGMNIPQAGYGQLFSGGWFGQKPHNGDEAVGIGGPKPGNGVVVVRIVKCDFFNITFDGG